MAITTSRRGKLGGKRKTSGEPNQGVYCVRPTRAGSLIKSLGDTQRNSSARKLSESLVKLPLAIVAGGTRSLWLFLGLKCPEPIGGCRLWLGWRGKAKC